MPGGYRPSERITLTLFPDEYPPSPNGWTRKCIDMFQHFTIFSSFGNQGFQFASNQIFFPVHTYDFWIDEVSIQQGENQSIYVHTACVSAYTDTTEFLGHEREIHN